MNMKPEENANRRVKLRWQTKLVKEFVFVYILCPMGPGWIRRHTRVKIHEAIH